jgi:hypothetical protein
VEREVVVAVEAAAGAEVVISAGVTPPVVGLSLIHDKLNTEQIEESLKKPHNM